MNIPAQNYGRARLIIMVGIIATTLPQQSILAAIPLRNLLKNDLGLDRTQLAAFMFWAGFAWYLKPLAGVLTDAFPLFGTRRRSYMLIGGTAITLGWLATAFVPYAYGPLLAVLAGTAVFMVMASSATGGLLVETAHAAQASGRLASWRTIVSSLCVIAAAPISGYLAKLAFGWTGLACALAAFTLVPVAWFWLKEDYHPPRPLSAAKEQFRAIINARAMWAAAGLMLLFYIAPGTSTALFYKQQNELHMDTVTQGWLGSAASVAAILTALLYARLCKRFDLRTLLMIGIAAASLCSLSYLFYINLNAAFVIETVNGVGFTLAELAFLDLATRATPLGSESLGYSLMLSVRNLALFGTDILGSKMLDSYGWSFDGLVVINAATTAIALPLVLLLPRTVLQTRDA